MPVCVYEKVNMLMFKYLPCVLDLKLLLIHEVENLRFVGGAAGRGKMPCDGKTRILSRIFTSVWCQAYSLDLMCTLGIFVYVLEVSSQAKRYGDPSQVSQRQDFYFDIQSGCVHYILVQRNIDLDIRYLVTHTCTKCLQECSFDVLGICCIDAAIILDMDATFYVWLIGLYSDALRLVDDSAMHQDTIVILRAHVVHTEEVACATRTVMEGDEACIMQRLHIHAVLQFVGTDIDLTHAQCAVGTRLKSGKYISS